MATTTITTTNNYHNHHYQEEEIEEKSKSINNYKYVDELCTDISDYLEYLSELAKKEIRRSEEYNRNIDNDDGVDDDDDYDDNDDDDSESDEKIQLSDSVYKFIEDYKNYKNNPFPAFSNNMCKEDIDGKDVRRRESRRGGFWKYSKFDKEAFNEKIKNYILSTSSSQNITKVDNINVLGLLESFYDAVISSNVDSEKVEAHDDATITKDKETSYASNDNDDGGENSSAVRLLKLIKHNDDLIIKNNDLIKSSSFSSYLSSPESLFNFNHLFDSSNYSKWLVSSSSFFASSLFKEKLFNSGNKNNDDVSNSDSNSDGVDNSKKITNKEGYENNDDSNNNKEKTYEDKKLVTDNKNDKVIQSEKSPSKTKQQINLEKYQFDLIEKILSYTKSEILRPQIPSILWDRWEVI